MIPPLYCGFDGSVSRNTSALVGVYKHEDDILVPLVKVWEPPINFDVIFNDILELRSRGLIYKIAFDPFQAVYLFQRLARRGVRTYKFPQTGGPRYHADNLLILLIRSGRLKHGGQNALKTACSGTNIIETNKGVKLTHSKHADNDAAIALSMGTFLCLKERGGKLAQVTTFPFTPHESASIKDVISKDKDGRTRRADTNEILIDGSWYSTPAVQMGRHPTEPIYFKYCPNRTKATGCPACNAFLRSLNYHSMSVLDQENCLSRIYEEAREQEQKLTKGELSTIKNPRRIDRSRLSNE